MRELTSSEDDRKAFQIVAVLWIFNPFQGLFDIASKIKRIPIHTFYKQNSDFVNRVQDARPAS